MNKNTMNIPENLPLSKAVLGLRTKWEQAEQKLSEYKSTNARYAPRKSLNALYETEYTYPALTEAKKALQEQEIEAVAAGKPLPDRQKILGPIEKAVADYPRMIQALKSLAEAAYGEFVAGVKAEVVSMGLREAAEAQKARDAWEKAYKAAMEAKAALERHAGLFSWCVTDGAMDAAPRTGHSQGDNLEYWELNDDGMLTWEASLALEYQSTSVGIDSLVKTPGLIESNPNPPVVEEYNDNRKPQQFLAKDSGYEASWF